MISRFDQLWFSVKYMHKSSNNQINPAVQRKFVKEVQLAQTDLSCPTEFMTAGTETPSLNHKGFKNITQSLTSSVRSGMRSSWQWQQQQKPKWKSERPTIVRVPWATAGSVVSVFPGAGCCRCKPYSFSNSYTSQTFKTKSRHNSSVQTFVCLHVFCYLFWPGDYI